MNDGCWDVVNDFDLPVWYGDSNPAFSGSGNVQFFNRGGVQILILPEFTNDLNTLQFEFKGDYYDPKDNQGTLEIGYFYGDSFNPVCISDQINTPRSASTPNSPYMGPYALTGNIPSGSRMALRYTPREGAVVGQTSGLSAGLINLDDFRVSLKTKTFVNTSGDNQWSTAGNWEPAAVPTISEDIIINAACEIPANCIAQANSITFGENGSLTIADGGQLFCNSEVTATVQKNIAAHGANAQEGGWNFIATPIVNGTTPSTTNGILSSNENDYDLFFYDEPTHYWRNYKDNVGNTSPRFDLINGQGYLYANAVATTLSFTGTLRPSNEAYTNDLIYTSSVGNLAGWNLVGNPFACNATVDRACYIIQDGVIVATNGTVAAPCSGVMVKATATGQTVTFTPTTNAAVFSTGHNQLNVTIANNMTARGEGSMIDNAIVSFNENSQLEKFVFFEDNAKLYIPQGEKDYAIVSAEAQGEMPVCFKATKNGEYTITVSPESVDLNYLHLIDNMTGMDVDLLQTPNYTFEASTRDYESRFKLVFAGASTDSATDESFAYYDGSEWKVSNEGEATLQVVDVLGRIVKSESINGNFSLNLNQKAGVYMLRLINGENVKVQKVVVR